MTDTSDTCLFCFDNPFLTIIASLLWLVLLAWLFFALGIVADDYLIPALERIQEYFEMPSNVAAATFLAFGSAVPEIMTSIISTLRGKVDASLPAILGSGCIAYAVIPPVCCLAIQPFCMSTHERRCAEGDVADFYLTKRLPKAMQRKGSLVGRERLNSLTEMTGTAAEVLRRSFSSNGELPAAVRTRSNSGAMNAQRNLYLREDVDVFDFLDVRLLKLSLLRDVVTYIIALGMTIWFIQDSEFKLQESIIMVTVYVLYVAILYCFKDKWGDGDEPSKEEQKHLLEGAEEPNYSKVDTGAFPLGRKYAESVDAEEAAHAAAEPDVPEIEAPVQSAEAEGGAAEPPTDVGDGLESSSASGMGSGAGIGDMSAELLEGEDDGHWLVLWLSAPFYLLFQYTIPDCETDDFSDWYVASFVISIIYIALLATATLWVVTQLCFTMGLPQSLSGVTLIALGAEIPDAVASMALAKKGDGAGAVSNCLNSQIINLLVGLGLPYLVHNIAEGEAMPLGEAGDTQVLIGILLSVLVLVFLSGTCCMPLCPMQQKRIPEGSSSTRLTVGTSTLLLALYVAMVVFVSIYSYTQE